MIERTVSQHKLWSESGEIALDDQHSIFLLRVPATFVPDDSTFASLWDSHPNDYHTMIMHGKEVKTPRWQQAYGKDYRYSGAKNNALPVSEALLPFLRWCRDVIEPQFNGLLLNWYDAASKQYIGKHRDDTRDLIPQTPIVTISFGQSRVFRMRPWRGSGFRDFSMANGSAIVIPWETNLAWTHEVPHFARYQGQRLSITMRAFK